MNIIDINISKYIINDHWLFLNLGKLSSVCFLSV